MGFYVNDRAGDPDSNPGPCEEFSLKLTTKDLQMVSQKLNFDKSRFVQEN